MNRTKLLGVVGLAVVFATATGFGGKRPEDVQDDPVMGKYLTIGSVNVEEVEDEGLGRMGNLDHLAPPIYNDFANPEETGNPGFNAGGTIVAIAKIVNIGLKIWEIIDKNQPVVDVQSASANALPKGAQSWEDLAGWEVPETRVFRVRYKNLYGATVVSFTYRLIYTYGGTVDGQGRYLANVTVLPADLNVAWGYKFSAKVDIPAVLNAGTNEAPLAAMNVNIHWQVHTVMKDSQSTESYHVRGNGDFHWLR